MIIDRPIYLKKLIDKRENGLIKVITGIRRCGKSFLFTKLYHSYLNSDGVDDKYIIELSLDDLKNSKYRNPYELDKYIRKKITSSKKMYYVFIDEIQNVEAVSNKYLPEGSPKITFVDVLLGLMKQSNIDLYVSGSNSKMLSTDILTEFRGRSDEIRVYPFCFSEYVSGYKGNKLEAWNSYYLYGGMPLIMSRKSHDEKSLYLKNLFNHTYMRDVFEHNKIKNNRDILENLLDIISSSIGSLTNPNKIANTFMSEKKIAINSSTISMYLEYFIGAFLINSAKRYDVKGRKYIGSPQKYYFTDIGLRNARLNFRQNEENHIMENIIYNDLIVKGFDVDVGVVEYNFKDENGKKIRSNLEIDFVANKGNQRIYVQSAFSIPDEIKREQEISSLRRVKDSFKKIVVVKDNIIPWYDANGILFIGIDNFLLNSNSWL